MRLAGLDPARPEHVGLLANSIDATYQAAKKAIDGTTKKLAADNNVKASRMLRVDSEWLATGEGEPRSERVWPLSHELLQACRAADQRALVRAENAARVALDMAPMSVVDPLAPPVSKPSKPPRLVA